MKTVYSKYKWESINYNDEEYNRRIFIDTFGNTLITIGHYKSSKPKHWQISLTGRLNHVFTSKEINRDFLDHQKLEKFIEKRLKEYFSKALAE